MVAYEALGFKSLGSSLLATNNFAIVAPHGWAVLLPVLIFKKDIENFEGLWLSIPDVVVPELCCESNCFVIS